MNCLKEPSLHFVKRTKGKLVPKRRGHSSGLEKHLSPVGRMLTRTASPSTISRGIRFGEGGGKGMRIRPQSLLGEEMKGERNPASPLRDTAPWWMQIAVR